MIIKNTGSNLTLGNISFSGTFIESLEAGENISVREICYIETDSKAYLLDDTMTTKLNQITVMALEAVTSGGFGRFLLKGELTYTGWTLTAGNGVFVPLVKGEPDESTE